MTLTVVYLAVAAISWPLLGVIFLRGHKVTPPVEPLDMVFAVFIGLVSAAIWPISFAGIAVTAIIYGSMNALPKVKN